MKSHKDKKTGVMKIKDYKLDMIYINGESLVKSFSHIEPFFKQLMFEEVR